MGEVGADDVDCKSTSWRLLFLVVEDADGRVDGGDDNVGGERYVVGIVVLLPAVKKCVVVKCFLLFMPFFSCSCPLPPLSCSSSSNIRCILSNRRARVFAWHKQQNNNNNNNKIKKRSQSMHRTLKTQRVRSQKRTHKHTSGCPFLDGGVIL